MSLPRWKWTTGHPLMTSAPQKKEEKKKRKFFPAELHAVCPECGELYVQKENLVRHRKHHNDWIWTSFPSVVHGVIRTVPAMSDDLPCHMNSVHLKIKPFKCETCKRLFAYKGNLEPGNHSYTVNAQVHVCGH